MENPITPYTEEELAEKIATLKEAALGTIREGTVYDGDLFRTLFEEGRYNVGVVAAALEPCAFRFKAVNDTAPASASTTASSD